MFDSLLGVKKHNFEGPLLVIDGEKWKKYTAAIQFTHAAQLPGYWESRNMDAALFHPEQAVEITNCMTEVRAYYDNIDKGNLAAVRNFFASDSHARPFPFRRHLLSEVFDEMLGTVTVGQVESGTRYLRANHEMTSHKQIARFYSPEGRKLDGKHVLETMAGIRGLVYATGIFTGKNHEGKNVEISFADAWHFANRSTQVAERRTYLKSDPEAAILQTKNRFITPQHMLDKTTLIMATGPLEDTASSVIAEWRGFNHNPDLAHLMIHNNGILRHYFNVDGEKIR